jgi:hypothetical protein
MTSAMPFPAHPGSSEEPSQGTLMRLGTTLSIEGADFLINGRPTL